MSILFTELSSVDKKSSLCILWICLATMKAELPIYPKEVSMNLLMPVPCNINSHTEFMCELLGICPDYLGKIVST